MTGVEYLTEVEKMINELTDEEFLKLFGDIYSDEEKVIYEETFNHDQILNYSCYYENKEYYGLKHNNLNNNSVYEEGLGGAA
ncbi:hypothetical protein [Intestinibacter bartlettii]|uniref:hypothetical protein n=1 Tax=Intestinibacter bartlettii TaxID=261299 RepID=UPI00319EA4A1